MLLFTGITFCWLSSIRSTPILTPQGNQDQDVGLTGFDSTSCVLPPEFSGEGGGDKAQFLEDCRTLGKNNITGCPCPLSPLKQFN